LLPRCFSPLEKAEQTSKLISEIIMGWGRLAAFDEYLKLVQRLSAAELNRSENDLSSNLKVALAAYGLFGVLDTSSGTNRSKRPDITLYVDLGSADLGRAAEVVVEAKKPAEVAGFGLLLDALVDNGLWCDKFVPYVSANAERARYFILTTFERMLIVPITAGLRTEVLREGSYPSIHSRLQSLAAAQEYDLRLPDQASRFESWCATHLTASALDPPPLSEIIDLRQLDGADDLEEFASQLADIVVGREGGNAASASLLATVNLAAHSLDELPHETRRALIIYAMSAHGGMGAPDAEEYLQTHLAEELSEFLSASVHSLIGRLFAIKTIEDAFCLDVTPPLLPEEMWVFHSDRFNDVPSDELPTVFFSALGALETAANPAVRDLAATGRFYDWLAPQLDPVAFRRLIELFFSHSFGELDGDLLGRFFEIYAQRVDRRRRRELGQYYTPMPIVRYIWQEAMSAVRERDALGGLVVLDPGVGSGTFLIEGARQLERAGVERFWDKLHGFDISPQVIGVAQVNLYLTVLALLNRDQAEEVGGLNLYPTDSLDPRNGAQLRSVLTLMTDESTRNFLLRRIELSEQVKQNSRFPVVIGNPPYKHNSSRTLAQMAEAFPALLRSTRANARAQENTIREDYAWFFAAADHYLEGQGIIAFVVSDSFCYAPSFRYFREDLLRRYRIRSLVHLGRFIFRDVGPRTSFVIIVIERRPLDLGNADEAEPVPYIDLRQLADGHDALLGTQSDPRLIVLDSGALPAPIDHVPTRIRNFRLFPAGAAVPIVLRAPVSLIENSRRVFIKKWPGAVTGFDKIFKDKNRAILAERMQALFDAAALPEPSRASALAGLSAKVRLSDEDIPKLAGLADMIASARIEFAETKIKKTISGTAPRSSAWYPDEKMTNWVYYEPEFTFERAVNEGKVQGWGNSNQWREHATHEICPKFVFTTSTNPAAGLKAFVLNDDWLVLKAAGTRQQLNYTGLVNPLRQRELGPNNLGGEALFFHQFITSRGKNDEDFLLYLAAIYNSELAEEYLQDGGENHMRIPLDTSLLDASVVDRVITNARAMRNLTRLLVETKLGAVPAQLAEELAQGEDLSELAFVRHGGTGGRFRQDEHYEATETSATLIMERREELQAILNDDVLSLYASHL